MSGNTESVVRRTDQGVVFGWHPMHEKPTHVELIPNPYGPGTPKKLDIGIDYPEAGIVRFSHDGPAPGHGVKVDIHFGPGGEVRVLAWTDPCGERDADLVVALRQNSMKVDTMRPSPVVEA